MSVLSVMSILFYSAVNGHGRLTVPATRKPTGYENDPVPYNTDSYVCRNAVTAPATTLTAGQKFDVRWDISALHVGDCAIYLSYDFGAAHADMQWFKIANYHDCKAVSGQQIQMDLPDWLPAGRAVLRWEWYALHVFPSIEFYAQCSDINIVAGPNAVALSSIAKYKAINPATLPARGDSTPVGFRNAFGTGEQFMTGPACANGFTGNDCWRTAAGTTGHIDMGGSTTTTPVTSAPVTDAPVTDATTVVTNSPVTSAPVTDAPYTSTVVTNVPVTAAPAGSCEVHEVAAGDTLDAIATAYTNAGKAVTWEAICNANKQLSNCAAIQPGDSLLVPCAGCGTYSTEGEVKRVLVNGLDRYETVATVRCTPTSRRRADELEAPTPKL